MRICLSFYRFHLCKYWDDVKTKGRLRVSVKWGCKRINVLFHSSTIQPVRCLYTHMICVNSTDLVQTLMLERPLFVNISAVWLADTVKRRRGFALSAPPALLLSVRCLKARRGAAACEPSLRWNQGRRAVNMTTNIRYKSRIPVKTGECLWLQLHNYFLPVCVCVRNQCNDRFISVSLGVALHPCTCASSSSTL